jgi:hypothetical protein
MRIGSVEVPKFIGDWGSRRIGGAAAVINQG